jgi:hypothetical protein
MEQTLEFIVSTICTCRYLFNLRYPEIPKGV